MKRALAILVFVALVVPPMGTAGAASTHVFRGGGWGHGVGGSQYGMYGLAQKGWGRDRIIRQYYRDTTVETKGSPVDDFRIGLLQNRGTFTFKVLQGSLTFKLDSGTEIQTLSAGQTRRVEIRNRKYRIYNGSKLVGDQAWGSKTNHLRVVRNAGGVIHVNQWGHAISQGPRMELNIISNTRAHLVALIPPDPYLYGLAEVPSSWPAKVLQIQAILGRTYAFEKIGRVGNNRSGCNCGLYATTADQHYTGWTKESGAGGGGWVASVEATAGLVVTHNGKPIQAYYSSSSGGMTDSSAVVWGGSFPYLRKACDPGDYTGANPNRTWSLKLSDTSAASRLRNRFGWNIARVTQIKVLDRGAGGYIDRVRVRGKKSGGGDATFTTSGENLRIGLSLKSSRVWINANRQVTGAIRNHYDGLNCKPGLPRSARTGARGGEWQRFVKGRIYSKSRPGTHWIHGPTLTRYLKLKGPNGRLRYPKTGVQRISDGRDRVIFQKGRIICKRSTGSCNVKYT